MAQARSLRLSLRLVGSSWAEYETRFGSALARFRSEGTRLGVYGDIDIAGHRQWVQMMSASQDMVASLPLWGSHRGSLLDDFFRLGFRARIIAVKAGILPRSLLGRDLDPEVRGVIALSGADLAGENGEYHTVVYDGPLFSRPLSLVNAGVVRRDGYWFQDVLAR